MFCLVLASTVVSLLCLHVSSACLGWQRLRALAHSWPRMDGYFRVIFVGVHLLHHTTASAPSGRLRGSFAVSLARTGHWLRKEKSAQRGKLSASKTQTLLHCPSFIFFE